VGGKSPGRAFKLQQDHSGEAAIIEFLDQEVNALNIGEQAIGNGVFGAKHIDALWTEKRRFSS